MPMPCVEEQMSIFDPDTWSGKTSPELSAATVEKTSLPSLRKQSGSQNRKPPPVSVPEKGWPTSGCFMGDKWSVAWRVLDAQFWGVPQRRRRIALVADFGGRSAPEILFVRESVSGHFEPGKPPGKEIAGSSGGRPAKSSLFQPKSVMDENWQESDVKNAIRSEESKSSHVIVCSVENHPADSRVGIDESGKVQTLTGRMGTGGG